MKLRARYIAFFVLLKQAALKWRADNCLRLGASLSYYTIFSLAPLLVLVIAVAGLVFGAYAARGEIVSQLSGLVGADGAVAISIVGRPFRF